ncbi:MAG: cytochrome c peroxidase, partial [Planctomycetota bacterium]
MYRQLALSYLIIALAILSPAFATVGRILAQEYGSESTSVSNEIYPEYHQPPVESGYLDGNSSIVEPSGYDASYPEGRVLKYAHEPEYDEDGEYRQPTSFAFANKSTLLVSTKKSGQILAVRTEADLSVEERTQVVFESGNPSTPFSFGKILKVAQGIVAVVEESQSQILIFQFDDQVGSIDKLQMIGSLSAPGLPKDLEWDAANRRLFASATWGQRLYVWQLDGEFNQWTRLAEVDLPMCGGQVQLLPKHDAALVVDAFGRDYAFVSLTDFRVLRHDLLYGHNVTDLAATEDESMVFFPHQLINDTARSVTTNITWGGLMSNNLRWLRVDRMLQEEGIEIFKKGKFYPLGTPGNGAGDPSSLAVSSADQLAVTLAGTNRVAIQEEGESYFWQIDVGFRPVDCVYSADDARLFVLCQFSDEVSVVDLKKREVEHWSLGKLRYPDQVEIGERLFFSSKLSHDAWMSCHSCHSQGHTNG